MKTKILFFGQLVDVTGTKELILEGVADTDTLMAILTHRFPVLADSKYSVAVDQEIISTNTILSDNTTIALLPPFSGG